MPRKNGSPSGQRKRMEVARCLDQATMRTDTFVEQTQALDQSSGGDNPKIHQQSQSYTEAPVLHENIAVNAMLLLGVELLGMMGYRACRSLSCVNADFRVWDAWKVNLGLNQTHCCVFLSGPQLSGSQSLLFAQQWQQSHSQQIQAIYKQVLKACYHNINCISLADSARGHVKVAVSLVCLEARCFVVQCVL
jgi:hypothetical protein